MSIEPILGFFNEYRFLSNFYPSPFTVDGWTFKWNEQWYMAHKTLNPAELAPIMTAATAGECKKAGRSVTLRPDWDEIKDRVMLDGLRMKFRQNGELAERLIMTDKRYLEETNTWGDRYWGVCGGKGKNMLGLLLMQVRAELT